MRQIQLQSFYKEGQRERENEKQWQTESKLEREETVEVEKLERQVEL